MKFRPLLQRQFLWAALAAVLLPLIVLLWMQYRWLADLERHSAVAQQATLDNYLEAVSSKVEYFYRAQAERALNIPEELLLQGDPLRVVPFFKKKAPSGVKLLFVVNFANPGWHEILLYDPASEVFGEPAKPEMAQAITVALAPWRLLHQRGAPLAAYGISADERDPDNRIVLNPLGDAEGRVLGVAGMLVDQAFFMSDVLPTAIGGSLPQYFDRAAWEDLLISVRDGGGRIRIGAAEAFEARLQARRRLPFVFADWELALGTRGATAEPWARSNFRLNLTLSIALAGALLLGSLLALRAASRAVRLSEMKSEFVSNVSHELRTPLASIRVLGELLRLDRAREPGKTREYGALIEAESLRLTALIDDVLDFSRVESGVKTYRRVPTDLPRLVVDTLRALEPGLAAKGCTVALEPADGPIPATMELDPAALARALVNLVDNAAKHARPPAPITVGLARRGPEVALWVADRGAGIPRDEQRRIFERFHRLGTGLVHDVKGAGLGLSIVDGIVRAHGGRITVDSEVGRGSTFTIHLPVGAEILRSKAGA